MNSPSTIGVGEPAPWFSAATATDSSNAVAIDELGGRYIVLLFLGAAAHPDTAKLLADVGRRPDIFDGRKAIFVGISNSRDDFNQFRSLQGCSGQLFLWDSTGVAEQQYGVASSANQSETTAVRPVAFVLSPGLQIIQIVTVDDPTTFVGQLDVTLAKLLANPHALESAPVLVVPQVFDRDFCRRLIDLYDAAGGREIGAIENDGKIVERFDQQFRRRLDYYISDEHALQRSRELLTRRLLPMVYRAFQFRVTRIERYLVGCYDAKTGGYFRPHRDNTAPVVAHRRFALTINLNEDYDGGDLAFPEYGHRTYRATFGDAIVFSCSLLHEVTPVTRNRRYAFISFLYDEESQRMREEYKRSMVIRSSPSGR